jgi:hypothetical protein
MINMITDNRNTLYPHKTVVDFEKHMDEVDNFLKDRKYMKMVDLETVINDRVEFALPTYALEVPYREFIEKLSGYEVPEFIIPLSWVWNKDHTKQHGRGTVYLYFSDAYMVLDAYGNGNKDPQVFKISCAHDYAHTTHGWTCYHEYTCKKCGSTYAIDSSD